MGPELTHILDGLGWALIHSLWQGAIAFLLVVLIQTFLKTKSPSLRYGLQMVILLGCFLVFVATLVTQLGAVGTEIIVASGEFNPGLPSATLPNKLTQITPYLGVFWCLGFVIMAMRYTGAFVMTQRLRRIGISSPSDHWARRFQVLVSNSGFTRRVELHISKFVQSPVTFGFFKPVVLVPVGFLTRLPQDQIEAILLHEIAHIRRYDYAINLLQTAIKTVFFYHPAVQYISRKIDIDREQACDDLAVAECRNPQALAQALAAIKIRYADDQGCDHDFAMAAQGKDTPLMTRLKRLVGTPNKPQKPGGFMMSVLTALLVGGLYFGGYEKVDAQIANLVPLPRIEAVKKGDNTQPGKHKMIRDALYKQLINDGVIKSSKETVELKFVANDWVANGKTIPSFSEEKYCRLTAKLAEKGTKVAQIDLSPKSLHVISKSRSNPKETREVTYGELKTGKSKVKIDDRKS